MYLNSLNGELILDDHWAVLNNADVDATKTTIGDVFLDNYWGERVAGSMQYHNGSRQTSKI